MIIYRQKVKVIEDYEYHYDRVDFENDCADYDIEGVTYEDVEKLLTDDYTPDFMICVNETYIDQEANELKRGPHMVSARYFFAHQIADYAFQYGYDDRDEIEVFERNFDSN